jgi:phosphoribosyl-dephospho-CoA transferase
MSSEKQQALVRKLGHLTEAGILDWQETVEESMYQVALPAHTIKIWTTPNEDSDDLVDVWIAIINAQGNEVQRFSDVEIGGSSRAWYELMLKLYEQAKSKALGVDAVLDEVLQELNDILPF